MKIFVDDIRSAPDESWVVARTVNAAIDTIARFKHEIKEISLDHDISHQIYMAELSRPYPCDETFMAVAHFIGMTYVDKPSKQVPAVHIHSANPVGVSSMRLLLQDYGIIADTTIMKPANRLEMEI